MLLCWVHKYLQILYTFVRIFLDFVGLSPLSLYDGQFLSHYSHCFKVRFAWYNCPCLLLHSICTKYLLSSLHLWWASCGKHIDKPCFSISSATLCFLIGEFRPPTLKVITDRYVLISILLIVCWMFCISFVPLFFPCFLPLWFHGFLQW